jgi:hypothetical protein
MVTGREGARDYARIALAGIRLVNGGTALLAPGWLLRRLQVDPTTNRAALYVFRMFGIRTVLVGAALLSSNAATRDQALRDGILIHASDTTAAVIAGLGGQLPPRAAAQVAVLSGINTFLAFVAQPRRL